LRLDRSKRRGRTYRNRFEQSPVGELGARSQQEVGLVSAVAVIVLIVVALLLAAMLLAALRRSAASRHAGHGPSDDPSFRSHAEASRGDRS
jgi:hypothetical protein